MKIARGITRMFSIAVLAGSVALTGMSGSFSAAAETSPASFDENNIVLSFGAVSDTHVYSSPTDGDAEKFKTAITQLKARSNNNLDALLVAGDCSGDGTDDALQNFQNVAYSNLPASTRLFAIGGNHDGADQDQQLLSKLMGNTELAKAVPTCTAADLAQGDYHTVIKGYHFIGMSMKGFVGDTDAYDLDWLKVQLAAAKADDPNKPIFLTMHGPAYDTIYGSHMDDNYETTAGPGSKWNDTTIIPVLKDYPQTVVFSGHSHYPLNPETSIMQTTFTQVGTASVANMSNDPFYIDTDSSTNNMDSFQVSQGNLVQVDKNGVIRITRCDFSQDKTIRSPWVFPTATDSSKFIYTKDRGSNFEAPQFPDSSAIKASFTKVTTPNKVFINMTFTNAVSKQDIVQYYKVDITSPDDSTVYYSNYCHSNFYMSPDGKLPNTYNVNWGVQQGSSSQPDIPTDKDFKISITPYDSFGNHGSAISQLFNMNIATTTTGTTTTTTTATTSSSTVPTETAATTSATISVSDTISNNTIAADTGTTATTVAAGTQSPSTGDRSEGILFFGVLMSAAAVLTGSYLMKKHKAAM